MIKVTINGNEAKRYEKNVRLSDVISELYPQNSVLDEIKINKKPLPISEIDNCVLAGNETVDLSFITVSQSILRISNNAMQFLDWIENQNIENDIFSVLPQIVNGFEVFESALSSIKQIGRNFESKEDEEQKRRIFMEINSFVALENKDETVKRIKKVCEIYRKIFSKILETEGV
ncbi:hypothetical protein [Athalassotoga saccharophila]|uniref:hypothetical protein n=1 Tax=Athalassotoga saccharophila TaxID=1441386 RepID=UPI00137AAB25|nr:hypothetical protein [Athalassotoga saccharophila]BBJ27939.1 hypothetical protein ATHSA_0834 [Athalassotoga saccharophila]